MSWMKRPQGAPAAAPGAGEQPYAAAQQYGNQQPMYQNYAAPTNPSMQQPQYWQTPGAPQYNPQFGQAYQQQDYGANNANQFYQQYNQNYTNQGYNTNQASYQPGYYQNQPPQQQAYGQNKKSKDSWEDNWDWGWDETKQAQHAAQQQSMSRAQPAPVQQPAPNNANVIEESFSASDTWNWSLEEKAEGNNRSMPPPPPEPVNEPATLPVDITLENNVVGNELTNQRSVSNQPAHTTANEDHNVTTLNDRDVVKERLPNLALGKRFHLDNLTPQWSIESQMSQESSDGPHTQSESTYRSDNQSRDSSKSSPGLNTENSNFNYSQSALDDVSPHNIEWTAHSAENSSTVQSATNKDINKSDVTHEEIVNTLQELSLINQENPIPEVDHETELLNDFDNSKVLASTHPSNIGHSLASPNIPSQPSHNPPQPLNVPQQTSNLPVLSSNMSLPPQNCPPTSSSANLPPPTNFPPTSSQNPFKHAGAFSHKATAKPSSSTCPPGQAIYTPMTSKEMPSQSSNPSLSSPTAVNKVSSQHNRAAMGYPTANLETTPDNSERPDHPPTSAFRPMAVNQHIPENLEVAPKNDRNEYLQTAHLSTGDYGENTDFSRNPPPGLRRMVVGQQESEFNQSLNLSSDEPPPGLARMVPGQQTEGDDTYSQSTDDYMDRQIDGQPNHGNERNPFRQADGQQTPDNYTQNTTRTDRRPIGLDRMVPGEPSNDDYARPQQYPNSSYGTNEQRVVTGEDHDYVPISVEVGHSDIREQNMDGSDYSEQVGRSQPRNILGARDVGGDISIHTSSIQQPEMEQQREITMEGENLQDLSIISSTEISFSRDQTLDGADLTAIDNVTVKTDVSDELPANGSRRQSLNRMNTSGEDSERDRIFKSSPRRDKHKSTRDRDKDRHSKDDKKYDRDPDRRRDRDDRRAEKDSRRGDRDRRERDGSPEDRRHRRSVRSHRYETEDTDYYSDKERERRRYRENSYTSSKPPRPDDKDRRYRDDKDRSRRYATIERERRYEFDERDGVSRSRRGDRDRDRRDDDRRYERRYRDIDPTRKYGNLHREEEERRRVVTFSGDTKPTDCGEAYSSPSRADSLGGEEELNNETMASGESRRRPERARRTRHRTLDTYYDVGAYGTGYGDPYAMQRQYQYYEHLRLTNPAAYMEVYNKIMAGQPLPPPPSDPLRPALIYPEGYMGVAGGEDRGSVHSGRSSANNLTHNNTARYLAAAELASLRGAHSLRTDLSDRDFNTDASLNLQLEESTVRSERMTPFKFSTAHVKGVISSQHVVVVRPSYPVDGLPATVEILDLGAARARDPDAVELAQYPGPLVKGVTHKKSVIEYCVSMGELAARRAPHDVAGYALVWDLLALLLRQNGVVVGSDIAELLMKNQREYELKAAPSRMQHTESGRASATSSPDLEPQLAPVEEPAISVRDEQLALDRYREYLIVGNTQQALEWAMSNRLWGHALQLAAWCSGRTRALVAARFLASVPARDPLHTLYTARAARLPPAATGVCEEKWGDWRPHLAIILANPTAKPDADSRAILQMGDSLMSRGLVHSAQFCYVCAGQEFAAHPLTPLPAAPAPAASPPRLSLLLTPAHAATLRQHATNQALFATEIYEYACSLNHHDYTIDSFQSYKLVLAARLTDAGQYGRALAYTEQLARALLAAPDRHSRVLLGQVAALADRLKYQEPMLHDDPPLVEEGGDSAPASPRHHGWIDDLQSAVASVAVATTAGIGVHGVQIASSDPLGASAPQYPAAAELQPAPTQQHHYAWTPEQTPQQYLQPVQEAPPLPPAAEEPPPQYAPPAPLSYPSYGEEWPSHASYPDNTYWQGDATATYPYHESSPPLPAVSSAHAHARVRGLRRRVHPKPDTASVGFAPAPAHRPRPPRLSDLDIQIAHGRPAAPSATPAATPAPRGQHYPADAARSRYGAVISNTVDTWARRPGGSGETGARYKPLVFGGTYPIEVPASPPEPDRRRDLRRTIERSLDAFEAILARRDARKMATSKRTVDTFDIDEPISATETATTVRESDAGAGTDAAADTGAVTGAGESPRPMITMPGTAASSRPALFADYDDDRPANDGHQADGDNATPKTGGKREEGRPGKEEGKGKGGWFGGIFTKLSLRPPNQMILPDDKNPSIVWDADRKRWRNVDGEEEEIDAPPPPPPRAPVPIDTSSPLMPTAAPVSNIFKMQKGRHIKKSYVDVFNPSGAATRPLPPAAEVLGPAPLAPVSAPAYLVPAPAPADTQLGYNAMQAEETHYSGM